MLPSGEQFDCAENTPILNAAHAANVLISYSCRSGQCGSCIGKLVSGEIAYPGGLPDAISSDDADAGYALFCSAVAHSDLTIELVAPAFADG